MLMQSSMIFIQPRCSSSRGAASFPDDSIDSGIDQQNKQGERVLDIFCQAGGVDQGCKVVLDKPCFPIKAGIPVAEPVFKRRQWTDPAKQFNQDAPRSAGQMQPRQPVKAQYQQAARHDKYDKRGVQDKDKVGLEMNVDVPPGARPAMRRVTARLSARVGGIAADSNPWVPGRHALSRQPCRAVPERPGRVSPAVQRGWTLQFPAPCRRLLQAR